MLEGRQENLDRFYELGYRLITFTWNFDNCLGTAAVSYTHLVEAATQQICEEQVEKVVSVMRSEGLVIG